jgi:hypothetical protein
MNNLTYEDYMRLMGMGTENTELADKMKRQTAQAQAMQTDVPTEMQKVGTYYAAPTGLEKLSAVGRNVMAEKKAEAAAETKSKINSNQAAQMAEIIKAIMAQKQQPAEIGGSGTLTPGAGANYGSLRF